MGQKILSHGQVESWNKKILVFIELVWLNCWYDGWVGEWT